MIIGIPHKLQNDDAGASGSGGLNLVELNDDGTAKEGTGKGETIDRDPDATDGDDDGPVDRGDTITVDTTVDTGAADDAGATGNRIPQARLNEVIAQRDADRAAAKLEKERADRAEAELAALRAGKPTPAPGPAATPAAPAAPAQPEFDERKAEKEYAELLADGEFEKAADLRMQINQQIREQAAFEVEERQAATQTKQSLETVAAEAVADFPYLDTAEGVTAMTAIMAERNRLYSAGGVDIAEALRLAVDKLAPKLAPEGFVAPTRGTPGKGSTTPNGRADTRPARAAARGAATEAGQPPALRGGQGSAPTGTVDVEDMSEAQFEALTPAERKRLRGD
jgi:hypothetical protein